MCPLTNFAHIESLRQRFTKELIISFYFLCKLLSWYKDMMIIQFIVWVFSYGFDLDFLYFIFRFKTFMLFQVILHKYKTLQQHTIKELSINFPIKELLIASFTTIPSTHRLKRYYFFYFKNSGSIIEHLCFYWQKNKNIFINFA